MKHQVKQYTHIIQVVTIAIVFLPGPQRSTKIHRTSKTVSKKREVFKNCCTGSVSHRILQSSRLAIDCRVSTSSTCGRFAGIWPSKGSTQINWVSRNSGKKAVSVGKYLQELERYNCQDGDFADNPVMLKQWWCKCSWFDVASFPIACSHVIHWGLPQWAGTSPLKGYLVGLF